MDGAARGPRASPPVPLLAIDPGGGRFVKKTIMPPLRHRPRSVSPTAPGTPSRLDDKTSRFSVHLDFVGKLRPIQENLRNENSSGVADPDDTRLRCHVATL